MATQLIVKPEITEILSAIIIKLVANKSAIKDGIISKKILKSNLKSIVDDLIEGIVLTEK